MADLEAGLRRLRAVLWPETQRAADGAAVAEAT